MDLDEAQVNAAAALFILALYSTSCEAACDPEGATWATSALSLSGAPNTEPEGDQPPPHPSTNSITVHDSRSGVLRLCLRVLRALGLHEGAPASL